MADPTEVFADIFGAAARVSDVIDGKRTFGLDPWDVHWVLDGHALPAPKEKADPGPFVSTVLLDHQLYGGVIARLRTAAPDITHTTH